MALPVAWLLILSPGLADDAVCTTRAGGPERPAEGANKNGRRDIPTARSIPDRVPRQTLYCDSSIISPIFETAPLFLSASRKILWMFGF